MFWQRYRELNDWEKTIKTIEKGEQKIQRQADIMTALAAKLAKYRNPWNELKLQVRVGVFCWCVFYLCEGGRERAERLLLPWQITGIRGTGSSCRCGRGEGALSL